MAEFGKTNRPRGGAARHWRWQLTLRRRERMLRCRCVCLMQPAACVSACICERLCIRADFVKLTNRVIEHKGTRRVRVWLLLFVCGGLFFVAGVPWGSGKASATLSSRFTS